MKVLAIDIGGTSVKFLLSGEKEPRKFHSGPTLTPRQMVAGVQEMTQDWTYDVVSIGYPGRVVNGQPFKEPNNLGHGWTKFDFQRAFGCPVRIMNDAAMQALGSYREGLMLFLGFGTGIGSAVVANGTVIPLELANLPFKSGTYEDYLGLRGLKKLGMKKWAHSVEFGVGQLIEALHPDDVVLGGGNVKKLHELPPGCRAGDNAHALAGGFRMWDGDGHGATNAPGSTRIRTAGRERKELSHGSVARSAR